MDSTYDDFIQQLHKKHTTTERFAATSAIGNWTTAVLLTLFPEQAKNKLHSKEDIIRKLENLENNLKSLLDAMDERFTGDVNSTAEAFIQKLPAIHDLLNTDIKAIWAGDPAAKSEYEIVRSYPGFYATAFYRIAHELFLLNVPMMPRIITEYSHSRTGIDIHPGATIGSHFCIDHGTGVVIGETCIIGNNVKLYQNITLGALSVSKELAEVKRHPTLEDNVVVYAGATILGGETIIGAKSTIGGNVWLTRSVPVNSTIYHQGAIKVKHPEEGTTTENRISNF